MLSPSQINGHDVTVADHKEVVKVIRSAGGKPLVMKVMFPSQPPANGYGDLPRDSLQSIPERGRHFSESSVSNHSPALGNLGRVPSGSEQGQRFRSRYDCSHLHERRLRQGSETSAPSSLQSTPTRQRVMSDSAATGREGPSAPVNTHLGTAPSLRGDSPLLPYQNGSASSLQSSQSSQSSSSQQGNLPESSSTATPQPTESEEDAEEDPSTLAKELQTAIKKREGRQRSQSVGVLNGEAEPSTHPTAGRERKMSAFESEVHQKVEERKSRVMEDKLRVTVSKQSAVEVAGGQPSTLMKGSLELGNPTTTLPNILVSSPRDSVDILTKLMAVVGQVPDKERDSLEGGFRQSWASDDSSSRPVSTVASPNVSHTQLLPVKEHQQMEREEESTQTASENGTTGDLATLHAIISQEDTESAAPVESPPSTYAAPPITVSPPPTTAGPPPTTSAPPRNTGPPSHNPTTPPSTTSIPSSNAPAPQPTTAGPPPTVSAPPPILPKPKWLKDGRPLKPAFTSASNIHTNPADDTRMRTASTSNLLAARPKEPMVPPSSAPPVSGGPADIVPDQHGWFDVKSLLKSSTAKQPAQEGVSTPRPTLMATEREEALPASQHRRMHTASPQPLVVAAAFDDEDGNAEERTEDRETVSLHMVEEQPATVMFDFDDVSSNGFDWTMWESSVTVARDLHATKGSTGDADGGKSPAAGGWPSFYDDDPVMEAWGEDETVHGEDSKAEKRKEAAAPLEENHQGGRSDEVPLGISQSILDIPPPITDDNSSGGEGEVDTLEELLEPVPPELLPPPLLDEESLEGERLPEDVFILPPPLEIEGATVDESSTDLPSSTLLPPSDIHTLTVEDYSSAEESSLPVISGDLPPPNVSLDAEDEVPPSAAYPLPPPPLLEEVLDEASSCVGNKSEEDSDNPSLPPPLADHPLEAKAGGRLSVVIDAPFDFQPFTPAVDPTSSMQQSDNESDISDLPPPPPSSAPPTDSPSDTLLDFMLPPPLDPTDSSHIAPVEISVVAPPPRFEVDAVDDEVFASSGSLVEVKDQEKLLSTPPSLRAPFSRYSLALEEDNLGLPSQVCLQSSVEPCM